MISESELQTDQNKLEDILSRDEFVQDERGFQFWEWIGNWIENFIQSFPDVNVPEGTGEVVTVVLVVFLITVILVALWALLQKILSRRRIHHAPLEFDEPSERNADDYLQEAESFLHDQRYAEAIRSLFIAGLLRMHEREWITVEAWKTNREYLHELEEHRPDAAEPFRRAAHLFEQVWYGRERADVNEYQQLLQWLPPAERGASDAQ